MMNSINNETPEILFIDHYYGLIEKLVEDFEQIELIESLTKMYKVKNPSFLKKLEKAANFKAFEENAKWHTNKMINDQESKILDEITSNSFNTDLEIQQAVVNVSKIESDNTEENSIIFTLPYTRLYLEVLAYLLQDKNEIEEENPISEPNKEKIFKYQYVTGKDEDGKEIIEDIEFSIRERLAMLRIFTQCGFLESKKEWRKPKEKENNDRYEICLSIIMGINPKSFKKTPHPFIENFWEKGTTSQKKEQIKSLKKMKEVTKKVRTQTSFKTIFEDLDRTLSIYD
jgi:hypothetical protein